MTAFNMLLLLTVVIASFCCRVNADAGEWGYGDTSQWPRLNLTGKINMCGGRAQTPINIVHKDSIYNIDLLPITFTVDGVTPNPNGPTLLNMTVHNNGHNIGVDFPVSPKATRVMMGNYPFRVTHMHWHWGSDNSKGSEHALDGKIYPMELHIVTFNEQLYSDVAQAASSPAGLAVLGFFFEVVPDDQGLPVMETMTLPLLNASMQVTTADSPTVSADIFNVPVFTLFHDRLNDYYRYMGSLTTPPCTENVLWTVAKKTLPVTAAQLERFRKVLFSPNHPMVDNFRVLQDLNPIRPDLAPRVVMRSFNSGLVSASSPSVGLGLLLALTTSYLVVSV